MWTDERIETLKKLYEDGLSASQIGAELGASRNAVIGKVHRIGLKRRGHRPAGLRPHPQHKPQRHHPISRPAIKRGAVVQIQQERYVEPPPTDNVIPKGQRCSLLELTSKTCRWPIGDPGSADFFFCGGPSDNNLDQPYCSYHSRVAVKPARPRLDSSYVPRRAA